MRVGPASGPIAEPPLTRRKSSVRNGIAFFSERLQVEDDRFVDQLFRGLIRTCRCDAPRQVRDVG